MEFIPLFCRGLLEKKVSLLPSPAEAPRKGTNFPNHIPLAVFFTAVKSTKAL